MAIARIWVVVRLPLVKGAVEVVVLLPLVKGEVEIVVLPQPPPVKEPPKRCLPWSANHNNFISHEANNKWFPATIRKPQGRWPATPTAAGLRNVQGRRRYTAISAATGVSLSLLLLPLLLCCPRSQPGTRSHSRSSRKPVQVGCAFASRLSHLRAPSRVERTIPTAPQTPATAGSAPTGGPPAGGTVVFGVQPAG